TSNAITHLANVHGIVEQGKLHIKSIKSGNIEEMLAAQNQRRWTNSCQHIADRKLTKWILHSTKPIETVNDSFLEDFLCYLNPNYKLPNEKNLKLLIHQSYDWTESTMRELLMSEAKYISFTTDLWTSRAKQGYIGVTASFMDSDFKIYDILLELKYLPYPHKAEHIRDALQTVMRTWNLQEKLIAITTDNGPNMVKAMSYFNNVTRIPCTAHTLQLAIGKGLAPVLILIARAKRLIRFFMYPKQMERLKAVQITLNYDEVLEVVDFTNEVTILDDDEEFEQLENNDNDEVIDPTTKQRIKISQPMPTNGKIEQIKDIISQALNKYWSIQSDIALKAAFLDPRFKHLSFARDEKER
ncbi:4593_t:CDS:2, partial [Funneliformis geosporum]